MNRTQLIDKAMLYREQGCDLPADIWSGLMNEGICPLTLMSEDDYFQHQESISEKE